MGNCCNCSAPLPGDTMKCEYCGTVNDIDLAGVHYYTTHEPEGDRTCPRCNIPLKTIDLEIDGKFLVERCDECLGLFFDPNELEALLQATVNNVFSINRSELQSISNSARTADHGVSYLKCPVCSRVMNRINFGAKSGVIVDRCKDHGVWLDAGELRHLFEWMKAGGKLLNQERREQQRQEEESRKEKERQQSVEATSCYNDYDSFDSYGSSLKLQDRDLFELVRSAIVFFLR